MEMFFFARFHVGLDRERQAAEALCSVLEPSRAEPGCLAIHAFRSTHDPRLFYVQSRWKDEAAFQVHAALPHAVHFIQQMESLLDQPAEFTHTELLG